MTGRSYYQQGYWTDIFPFEPYEKQITGINEAIDTLRDGGVYLLEGPCGTGKTLIALTAGLSLVRDPQSKFERVLVVTSKKQQIRAFEDDLEAINEAGGEFQGLTLVGKADVCPYVYTGEIDDGDIYHTCKELKESTDRLMREAVHDGRAEKKAEAALGLAAHAEAVSDPLQAAGETAPYQSSIPTMGGEDYCPFFAQHFVNDFEDEQPVTVDQGTKAMETLQNGVAKGTCPHIAMKQMIDGGQVLIGNYKHAFGPTTVQGFTGKILDDSTILVVDEAHELVQEVRSELSYSVTMRTLSRAIRDVELVEKWLDGRGHQEKQSLVRSIVDRGDYEEEEIRQLRWFLEQVRDIFAERIRAYLEHEFGASWADEITPGSVSTHSVPIQNEGDKQGDILERWVDENGADGDWVRCLYLSHTVAHIRESVAKKVDHKTIDEFAISKVRELLHRWLIGDHIEYFREVLLQPNELAGTAVSPTHPWQQAFSAYIRVNNCTPADEIAATLDAFGGVLLQSATLAPVEVYREVTGVEQLVTGTQPEEGLVTKAASRYRDDGLSNEDVSDNDAEDEDDDPADRRRPVKTSVFEIGFPESNRASFAVDAPKFTYTNRNPVAQCQDVRATYREIITTVATTTPGNVLVFMPSYEEASWAGEILGQSKTVQKPVLIDESSSDAATEELKREFFAGGPKVLTTGLRGTLTEGVDFDGDKLRGAVVCGVPIAHTGTELAEAIQAAYGYRFGGQHGFEYAFAVPAVRKARQAFGRVIRGTDDVGVRVLADKRYAQMGDRSDVREHLPEHVRDEFTPIEPDQLGDCLRRFWNQQ